MNKKIENQIKVVHQNALTLAGEMNLMLIDGPTEHRLEKMQEAEDDLDDSLQRLGRAIRES